MTIADGMIATLQNSTIYIFNKLTLIPLCRDLLWEVFFFQREGVFKAPQRQVVLVHSYCGTVEVVGQLPRQASVSLSVLVTANIHVCV